MGADFTYSLCPKAVDKETAMKRLLSLTDQQLLSIAESCGDEELLDEEEPDTYQTYRDTLIMDLDCVYGYFRDTATLHIDGKFYVITGGMSWGDEPTDSYKALWRIGETFITDTEENFEKEWANK